MATLTNGFFWEIILDNFRGGDLFALAFLLEYFDFEIVFENNFEIEIFITRCHGQGFVERLVRCSFSHWGLRPYFAILRMREL